MKWTLLLLLFCLGCSNSTDDYRALNDRIISGREPERVPLYRLKVPSNWECRSPSLGDSLVDTRIALCEFLIDDTIRVTIHNFPVAALDQRIPPQAQIQRWKQQMKQADPASLVTIPQSFSGFVGFLFEGTGSVEEKPTTVMGWSLQLGTEQFRTLSHPQFPLQMRADVTIKVTGPPELMKQHRTQIIAAARSFELIEEIPVIR